MAKTQEQKEQKKETVKGWTFVLAGIALLVKLILLSLFNINISNDTIDQSINIILGLASAFGIWRNNYVTKIGVKQFRLLQNESLQHFFKRFSQ